MDFPKLTNILVASLLAVSGCSGLKAGIAKVNRATMHPSDAKSIPRDAPFLKSHMKDGSVYILSRWKVLPGDSGVEGTGERLGINRELLSSGLFRVPRDSIVLFETNDVRASSSVAAYAVLAVGTAIGTALCITNPKACYGSCPTFYVEGEAGGPVHAEAFSASVAPSLEDTDVDALYRALPRGPMLRLRLTNEALETHVIRHADLLAVPRTENGRAARTAEGAFFQIGNLRIPSRARGPEGDCSAALAAFDEIERFSLADSTDLSTKEVVELEFPHAAAGERGVLISARQTLLTTYLFYQTLAYLGPDAGYWLARMERGDRALRSRAGGLGRALGLIEVWVERSSGDWTIAGEIGETGPIATDTYLVRLPADSSCPTRIRLRMTRGMWRVDQVALASVGERVRPARIRPRAVTRGGSHDPDALAALTDPRRTLTTLPGDEYVITYPLPAPSERYEFFLEARGYYLEWMREEWMKEKSPGLLAQAFLNPSGALRRLAPEFKKVEPGMESLFWGSRYVKR